MLSSPPSEPTGWAEDFSFDYLERLYRELTKRFAPTLLRDAAEPSDRPRVFVRHDVDVSLERAMPLANLERAWGVSSTYHVMLDSPFYRPGRGHLDELQALGHEVGLHYDVVARGMKHAEPAVREADVAAAAAELEALMGAPVRSVSFHLPVPELISGPLRYAGRISGYAQELFAWYLSDSRARWREGEPIASLDRPRARDLQILIHPIWWGPAHQDPSLRLRDWLTTLGDPRPYGELNDVLWKHIIHRAADA